jgi:hypothetical protein
VLTPEAEAQASAFEKRLDSALRVIVEVVPKKFIGMPEELKRPGLE